MQTVIETPVFIKATKRCGLAADEVAGIIDFFAAHPNSGAVMPDTGGMRKFRFPGQGKGKSGGYRVITFFSGPSIPVILITVYAKGDVTDLTKSEKNALKRFAKELSQYGNA
jgi:hypothetical protein